MDFMNLNQSAHGDREAGFIHTRLRLEPQGRRRPLVGPGSAGPHRRLDARRARLARLAGREVLPLRRQHAPGRPSPKATRSPPRCSFGFAVNGYGVGDLVQDRRRGRRRARSTRSCAEYEQRYAVAPELRKGGARHESLRDGARIELGLRAFLEEGGFKGFTTTFEDLHGLKQLPGLAVAAADGRRLRLRRRRRLEDLRAAPRDEGHGRRPARRHLVHGGLHLPPRARAAIRCSARTCSRSASRSPPASRRSKSIRSASAARRIPCASCSTRPPGPALNASLIDLGNRFRLHRQRSDGGRSRRSCPKLPVARAVWECRPDFKTACARVDLRRRRAPHRLQLRASRPRCWRTSPTIAGIELARDRRRHDGSPASSRPAQQRGLLSPRAGLPRLTAGMRRRAPERRIMLTELKREAYEANVALPRHGLINLTFGNASAIDRAQGHVRDQAERRRLRRARGRGHGARRSRGQEGRGQAQPVLGHADASAAVPRLRRRSAASCTRTPRTPPPSPRPGAPIPIFGTTHADYFDGDVPVTRKMTAEEIAEAYEWETGDVIVERLRRTSIRRDFPGVLVNRHAPVRLGADGRQGGGGRGRARMRRPHGADVAATRARPGARSSPSCSTSISSASTAPAPITGRRRTAERRGRRA